MAGIGASNTRITALNDHCLEFLMRDFSLNDLANIAVSNTRFIDSATFLFRRKYVDQLIEFDTSSDTSETFQNFVNILDAFGDKIRRLRVSLNAGQNLGRIIVAKMNANCGKSVMELNLSFVRRGMVFTKPFVNLRTLMITDSYFQDSTAKNLIGNSPNLSNIELHNVENFFNDAIVDLHIPSLVHFGKFNEIVRNPELEMENLQNFRRFVKANQQLTTLGVGSSELSYMLKYKLFRQQFYNEMHPDVPCPDKRDLITYLFPFESAYQQKLKHLHIRLGENVEFLSILRHRLIHVRNVPFEHVELYTHDIPLKVMDLLIQFRDVKKLQYFVRNKINPMMVGNLITGPVMLRKLTDLEFIVLNDEDIVNLDKAFIHDIGVLLRERRGLQRVMIGFEFPRIDVVTGERFDTEENIENYQMMLREDFNPNLPENWEIDFKVQYMDIQRQGTENVTIFCVVLTKNLTMNTQLQ